MKKNTNKIAVIVVDMQDFFLQHFNNSIRNTLIENQLKVLDLCAKHNIPLVIVEYKAGGKMRGSTTHKINQRIKTIPHKLIIKENNSAFTKTDLDKTLQSFNVKEVFIMGINANACVQDTAMSALHRGYQVIISKECTASASRGDMDLSKRNEEWYRKNCKLIDDLDDFLSMIN